MPAGLASAPPNLLASDRARYWSRHRVQTEKVKTDREKGNRDQTDRVQTDAETKTGTEKGKQTKSCIGPSESSAAAART